MRMIGQNDMTAAIADAQARVNTLAQTKFLHCKPQQECASDSEERQHVRCKVWRTVKCILADKNYSWAKSH